MTIDEKLEAQGAPTLRIPTLTCAQELWASRVRASMLRLARMLRSPRTGIVNSAELLEAWSEETGYTTLAQWESARAIAFDVVETVECELA
jgi:hypothetical protein